MMTLNPARSVGGEASMTPSTRKNGPKTIGLNIELEREALFWRKRGFKAETIDDILVVTFDKDMGGFLIWDEDELLKVH